MKNWDNRQIRTFFAILIFGLAVIFVSDAFGMLPFSSGILLGCLSILSVNGLPKERKETHKQW